MGAGPGEVHLPFHCLAQSEKEALMGICLCRHVGTDLKRHTQTHSGLLDATSLTVRLLFHYLLRLRQGELPPTKWSLPNRT